jgi:hypothetical protein
MNLERMDEIPGTKALAHLRQAKFIPRLNGAKVFLLGVDPAGKSASYFMSLKEFWLRFFAEAGADVRVFGVDRHLPEFEGNGGASPGC